MEDNQGKPDALRVPVMGIKHSWYRAKVLLLLWASVVMTAACGGGLGETSTNFVDGNGNDTNNSEPTRLSAGSYPMDRAFYTATESRETRIIIENDPNDGDYLQTDEFEDVYGDGTRIKGSEHWLFCNGTKTMPVKTTAPNGAHISGTTSNSGYGEISTQTLCDWIE